ncbi:unnamed protein product [Blumeria hordei]|uniref:Major facilitator superfamily (MFS) profile domain-containing protein n=2 Tax=Blumeria hordei TaxID=2867405 RepID=A0A383UU61_BLUHO|nr:MFS Transporter/carboxylic acid transport protein [Blumeria hordei DH14]SZF03306.1 unnamed protein product [Blumeria hordei]
MSQVASLDNKAADPIGTGIISTARQSWLDLFHWHHRVTTVLDGEKTKCEWVAPEPLQNPITLFRKLSARDWLFFIVGFLAWTADAFDFHALSIQTTKLARYYQTSNTVITSTITLTLLLRSLGAAIFGIAGDKIGRKWPMVLNMILLGLLQIATIYCKTLGQLLGVRSLFGLFMGGIYGNATAMALENCPTAARGLMSGILQQGYSFGYVLAACTNLGVGGAPESFKKVFWIGAGFCVAVGLIRILFPESKQFLVAKAAGRRSLSLKEFWRQTRHLMATEYKICLYCILLMTWFNFYSHSSQDSYTTFMEKSKGLSNSAASRASIWMKVGACVGGTIMGYISQFFGRRRTMIVAALVSTLMIPGWILPHSEGVLSFTGFLMQFFVQGAWGVIPIYLNELAPASYRSTFSGITYQVGNMISSPSTQIVNALAEHFSVHDTGGANVPAYGSVMGVATAFIALGIAGTLALGPERMGRSFEEDDSLLTTATGDKKATSSSEPDVV